MAGYCEHCNQPIPDKDEHVEAFHGRITIGPREARFGDRIVKLTRSESLVLKAIVRREGGASKQYIMEFLDAANNFRSCPDIKIVDVFVCKMRKKLREAEIKDFSIQTIWGHGYVLANEPPVPADGDWHAKRGKVAA